MGSRNPVSYWCTAFPPEIAEAVDDMKSGGGPVGIILSHSVDIETFVLKMILMFVCLLFGGWSGNCLIMIFESFYLCWHASKSSSAPGLEILSWRSDFPGYRTEYARR